MIYRNHRGRWLGRINCQLRYCFSRRSFLGLSHNSSDNRQIKPNLSPQRARCHDVRPRFTHIGKKYIPGRNRQRHLQLVNSPNNLPQTAFRNWLRGFHAQRNQRSLHRYRQSKNPDRSHGLFGCESTTPCAGRTFNGIHRSIIRQADTHHAAQRTLNACNRSHRLISGHSTSPMPRDEPIHQKDRSPLAHQWECASFPPERRR